MSPPNGEGVGLISNAISFPRFPTYVVLIH